MMTLIVKVTRGIEYLYFQAGKESVYIGPKSNPDKARQEGVIKAIKYAWKRSDHYDDSFTEMLPFLSPELRQQYIAKEITRLEAKIARYGKKMTIKSRR